MIDLNLPEPPEGNRKCLRCGKGVRLKGELIHWPSAFASGPVRFWVSGPDIEPFSMWIYECAWCRGTATRKRIKRLNAVLRVSGRSAAEEFLAIQSEHQRGKQ